MLPSSPDEALVVQSGRAHDELHLAEEGRSAALPRPVVDTGMRDMQGPADFISPRYSKARALNAAARATGKFATQAGVGIIGGVAMIETIASATGAKTAYPARDALMLGVTALSNQHLGEWLVKVTDAATLDGMPANPHDWAEWHQQSMAETADWARQQPDHIREPLGKIDQWLVRKFEEAKRAEVADTKDEVNPEAATVVDIGAIENRLRWRHLYFLNRPTEKKQVEAWKTEAGRTRLLGEIDRRLQSFPEENRADIKAMLIGIASQSVSGDAGARNNRQQFLLTGAPGTGKDHIVYNLVQELLGIPVAEVTIPDKERGGADGLLGTPDSVLEKEGLQTNDEMLLGLLLQAKLKCKYSNCVLYINEADLQDKSTRNAMKRLLDRGNDHIDVPGLETRFDFVNDIVFISSNDPVHEMEDQAVPNRMNAVLDLSRTLPVTRESAALKEFRNAAAPYCLPIAGTARSEADDATGSAQAALDLAGQQALERGFMAALPHFLAAHAAKVPGARMPYAARLTDFLATGLVEGTPRTQAHVHEHIRRFYGDDAQGGTATPAAAVQAHLQPWLAVQRREVLQKQGSAAQATAAEPIQPNTFSVPRTAKAVGRHAWMAARKGASLAAVGTLVNSQLSTASAGGFSMKALLPMTLAVPAVQTLGNLSTGIWNAFSKDGWRNGWQAKQDAHEVSKKAVAERMKDLPEHVRTPLQKIDRRLTQLFQRVENATQRKKPVREDDLKRIDYLSLWRNDYLLNRPTGPKEVTAWKTPEGRQALLQRIDRKLETYDESYRAQLKSLAISIAAHSVQHEGAFDMRRMQVALTGIPGTGKDFFVDHVLRDELGLEVLHVRIPEEKNGGADALLGKTWLGMDQESYQTKDSDLVGLLGQALLGAKHTNAVVYLSEADLHNKNTRNVLKKILDPSKKMLDAPSLETKIDFRHNTVIVSSNDKKDPADDGALWDRMDEHIELMKSTPQAKAASARKVFENAAAKHCQPMRDSTECPLKPDEQAALRNTFDQLIGHVVQRQTEACRAAWGTDGGARMDFVEMLTDHIAAGLIMGEPMPLATLKGLVDDHYRTRAPTAG